jgi:hypothetical protein
MPARGQAAAAAALDFDVVHKIEQQGERQLDLALKNVDPLKDIDFYDFVSQLRRERYHYKWPSWIYNREEVPPTAAELQELENRSEHDASALKELTAIRNAYLLLSRRCDNTTVSSVLQTCEEGDVATAFNSAWDFHYPRTQAGQQQAYKTFNNATMANTHTTIVEWTTHVSRLASILRTTGGAANDSAELCVLLSGLLPEFNDIKLHLEQSDGLSLESARRRLIAHASTKGQTDLRRGGKGTNTKVFHVKDEEKRDSSNNPEKGICRAWARGT